jgi:hypothetical protein
MNHVAATFATGVDDPTPAISGNGAAKTPRPTSSAELVSDYATAPAKFEGGEFRGLVSPLLRDSSKSGSHYLRNRLPKNRFAMIICPSFGGIAQLVERLVRNESSAR